MNDREDRIASLPPGSPVEDQLLINSVMAVRSHAMRKHGSDTLLLVLLSELETACRELLERAR